MASVVFVEGFVRYCGKGPRFVEQVQLVAVGFSLLFASDQPQRLLRCGLRVVRLNKGEFG